jgi:UDP-N-acetylmuramoyl-tripeptide--D-alanyl-D-alanine ligase
MNIRIITSVYSPRFPSTITYMLQASEYQSEPYLKWLWRTVDFSGVARRRTLKRTAKARMLEIFLAVGMLIEILAGLALIFYGALSGYNAWAWEIGAALLIAYPFIWSHLVVLPLEFGRALIVEPKLNKQVKTAKTIYRNHPGVKIAVAGSYGKTTMKELLKTVLSEGLKVKATVANKNVLSEHAKFAKSLNGDEEVLIIEYGEGAPGDVKRFAFNTHPTHGIITGLAPAHLNQYKTLEAAGADIFSLGEYLKGENVYVNHESPPVKAYVKPGYVTYGPEGVGKWQVSEVNLSIDGVSFSLSDGKTKLNLNSKLLGKHQIGALSLAAVIGLELGLTRDQVIAGVAKGEPFMHRMQPYELAGARVIDDTYNGNIEGIRAGTALLRELSARRKIYVTPGLVDQGQDTKRIHNLMGEFIASAKPDLVVLMRNSVTGFIKDGLKRSGYKGEIQIVDDPLSFYEHLDQLVAAGDLVLMQNDWTDNYA